MGGIEHAARSVSAVLHERLPWQRKTQRENLALLVATMLSERSANLMSLAAALPRRSERIDMRYQWIVRVLANPLIECDAVMLPFAREVLARAQADAGPEGWVDLILDQSRASERHQVLMLALRWGERALPLAWRVEETEGAIGFGVQKGLLDAVVAWLPERARVRLLGDRFYGTPALIGHCQSLGWDYRLRLKGNLRLWIDGADAGPVERLARDTPYLTGVELTARRVCTNVGFIQDPGHEEPWIVAMSESPGYLATLDYARRWGIDIDQAWRLSRIKGWMVSSRGAAFWVEPDRGGNLIVAERRGSTPLEWASKAPTEISPRPFQSRPKPRGGSTLVSADKSRSQISRSASAVALSIRFSGSASSHA